MKAGKLRRRACCAGLLVLLSGCASGQHPEFSPQDQSDLARIQAYLDGLHGLVARFVQAGPEGATSAGTVWYDPGRLRLVYDRPGRMEVVAAGKHLVAHRDSDDSTTRIALSANPLGLLLTVPLRLSGDIMITDLQRGPGVLQVSLARAANPAEGLLTLIFADQASAQAGGLALVGLEAVDARGSRTRIHLLNARVGLTLDPALFKPPGS